MASAGWVGRTPEQAVAEHVRRLKAKQRQAMGRLVLETERAVKLELSKPGSGRVYRSRIGGTHRASAPGQPPAVDTGSYRRAWQARPVRADGRVGIVEPTGLGQLGGWLEGGTPRMAPRPHAFKARDKVLGPGGLAGYFARALRRL